MKVVACYLGTFDPLTYGHLNVIERAAKIFDKLIIGIGHNREKEIFSPLRVVAHSFKSVCHIPTSEVRTLRGLVLTLLTLVVPKSC